MEKVLFKSSFVFNSRCSLAISFVSWTRLSFTDIMAILCHEKYVV